jgi:hypothetical protein
VCNAIAIADGERGGDRPQMTEPHVMLV